MDTFIEVIIYPIVVILFIFSVACIASYILTGRFLPPNTIFDNSPSAVAKRERDRRYDAYVVEYLTYGFDILDAEAKASSKMREEAMLAEGVTDARQ